MATLSAKPKTEPLTRFDYEFLTGTWQGVAGAAWNVVYSYCRNRGYGGYNDPTELGLTKIAEYELAQSAAG